VIGLFLFLPPCPSFSCSSAGSVFTTNHQTRKSDDYFLSSGRAISFFWEERAWNEDGTLKVPPQQVCAYDVTWRSVCGAGHVVYAPPSPPHSILTTNH